MSEVRDPAIKLFGKTIQLPLNDDVSADLGSERSSEQNFCCSNEKNETASDSKLEDGSSSAIFTDPNNKEPTKSSIGDSQTMPNSEDNNHSSSPKPSQKEEQSETGSSSQDNNKPPLKKPEKILPCPRCNSMDTKFCYFNNYNVNQPRHFCKNCQRYWTAGGTMRNVPVGAGRRKSKNSSHHRHIIIPETANGMLYPSLRPNGSVLAFGQDAPLCESMASTLNIAENSNSSNTNPKSAEMGAIHEKQQSASNNFNGFTPQVPCFPAPPWTNPWNPAQWSPTMQAPPFLPSGFPVSIYTTPPPPYWGCGVPGSWSMPWMQRPSGSADHSSTSSSPNSPLGKHSRDGNVLTPKTLRIDDPNEAAKSSIWATLGIKNEKTADSFNSGGLFRGFKSKGDDQMSSAADTSIVLQANPAALSRSLTFHESAQ